MPQEPASTRSRNVAIVFNPSKSRERLRAFIADVGPEVDRLTVYESSSAEDVVDKTLQAVSDGHGTVLAAGGDGTVFGVLNGVHASGAVLGVVPLGTSNDYARSLDVADVSRAALALTKGAIRLVDVGRCGFTSTAGTRQERLFCSTSGVGFTARLFQDESSRGMQIMKRVFGDFAFVIASLRHGFTFRGSDSDLVFDDTPTRRSVWLLSVNKVASEGGMPVTPFARLDSGYLDACLVPDFGIGRKLKLLVSLQRSPAHIDWPDVDYFGQDGTHNRHGLRGLRQMTVTPERQLPVHLNGEFVGYTPAVFEVVPSSLAVLTFHGPGAFTTSRFGLKT